MFRRLAVGLGALAILAAGVPAEAAQQQQTAQPSMNVAIVGSPPSGRATLSCSISSATFCGPFYPDANRGFHVLIDGVTGTGVGSCQLVRQNEGAVWYPQTVTAGGSTTTMENFTVNATFRASEDLEEAQAKVGYAVSCGASMSSVTYGSYTSGTIGVKFTQ